MSMRFDDLDGLPNGLHDAYILGVSMDPTAREARFELDAWVGDGSAGDPAAREARLRCTLVVSGLAYFALEPPGQGYAGTSGWGMVDSGVGQAHPDRPAPPLPESVSLSWIFLGGWNSFIHVAGTGCRLEIKSAP